MHLSFYTCTIICSGLIWLQVGPLSLLLTAGITEIKNFIYLKSDCIFHPHNEKLAKTKFAEVILVCSIISQAHFHIWWHIHLSQRGSNYHVLLQLKELANEVLLCETQRLQLTEDLLKYLQKKRRSRHDRPVDTPFCCQFHRSNLVKLGPVCHIQVGGRHVAHVQQWGRLGAPAVGALDIELVQAWGRAS